MELIAKGSFYRDISGLTDKILLKKLFISLKELESAKKISQVINLKKLREYETLYRIKIANDYRLGLIIRKNKVWLVCFGHRNKFYKNFP